MPMPAALAMPTLHLPRTPLTLSHHEGDGALFPLRRRRLPFILRARFHALASKSLKSCHAALVGPLKDGVSVENRGRVFAGHSAWHSPGIQWAFNGSNLAFRTFRVRGTLFFVDRHGPVSGWKLPNYNIRRGEGAQAPADGLHACPWQQEPSRILWTAPCLWALRAGRRRRGAPGASPR